MSGATLGELTCMEKLVLELVASKDINKVYLICLILFDISAVDITKINISYYAFGRQVIFLTLRLW